MTNLGDIGGAVVTIDHPTLFTQHGTEAIDLHDARSMFLGVRYERNPMELIRLDLFGYIHQETNKGPTFWIGEKLTKEVASDINSI